MGNRKGGHFMSLIVIKDFAELLSIDNLKNWDENKNI